MLYPRSMMPFQTSIHPNTPAFMARREGMLNLIDQWHALEQRAADASAKSAERFAKRFGASIGAGAVRALHSAGTIR